MNIITFGTFDLFHIGHLNMLNRCKTYGDKLYIGVSTDELNFKKKNRYPIINQHDRKKIIENIRCVDDVFFEEELELKAEYIKKYKADIFIIGDDWTGKFDDMNEYCKVIYLPRTSYISTTDLRSKIINQSLKNM
jgi:glycerol-3-phosphate cytidylyltransferase